MQRRYDYRRKLPHLQPDRKIFFITFSTSRRWILPDRARDIVAETCLRGDSHRFELHALVVMPDHVHLALTPRWDERGTFSIPEIMQEIKSVSAHRISKETRHVGRVWQEESFDRALRREEDLLAKIQYMLANPVRAGLANAPAEYRWIWIEGTESCWTGGAPVSPSQWAV
ncbi:MAG: REP-associated tyrosine transposase [Terriglobales bacterium]